MNLSSPAPVSPSTRLDDSALDLRVNQRLNAEVMKITGGQVILSVQGVQVVGRLASSEQAANLIERQFAHFIVRDIAGQTVTLQVLSPENEAASATTPRAGDLTAGVLEQAGLPATPENIILARAAIRQGLEVSTQLLDELRGALSTLGSQDPRALQAALALKAAGLPLSEGAIRLALQAHPALGETLMPLLVNLRATAQGSPSLETRQLAEAALAGLQGLITPPNLSSEALAAHLRQLTTLLGRSLENMLARQLQGGEASLDPLAAGNGMLALAELRARLDSGHNGTLANTIDRFLEGARWMNLLNLPANPAPDRGQWVGLNFLFQAPPQARQADPEQHPVWLRIARDSDPSGPQVRPGYTRLVIQVELGAGETLQVDCSVVEHQIGAEINASTRQLADIAQMELSEFQTGLDKIGYHLLTYQVHVAPPLPAETFELPEPAVSSVDPRINLRA